MLRALMVKEVGALFVSPVAYAIIAVFLLLSGYSFAITLIVAKQASLVPLFFQSAVQFILLVPILTMRLFAEERRIGTLELLLTSPAREIEIVLAKFAAAMTVLLAMIGLTLTYALVIGISRRERRAAQPIWRKAERRCFCLTWASCLSRGLRG